MTVREYFLGVAVPSCNPSPMLAALIRVGGVSPSFAVDTIAASSAPVDAVLNIAAPRDVLITTSPAWGDSNGDNSPVDRPSEDTTDTPAVIATFSDCDDAVAIVVKPGALLAVSDKQRINKLWISLIYT